MRTLFWVIACALTSSASAQTGYFQGITPRPADVYPFPASLTVTRSAPAGGAGTLVPAMYTHVTTDPDARSLEWANLTILNNHSAYGENVAVYAQANKFGNGPTWAGVLEASDNTGTGPLWGLEIDAFTKGPSRFDEIGGGDRVGLGVVVGRALGNGPKATIDYGMWILPLGLTDSEADVNFGVMVSTNCRYACYAMRAGNKLAWEESAQITSKFDPQTGTWGLYNGDRPVFQVNMTTGELMVNGRPAVVTYK
ncbi:MAG TPA: hypothetical protein VLI21_07660 [Casimicrobiaceae bacterium]|nr:hypothetical protein [Casimicrobiaceae bacterium]